MLSISTSVCATSASRSASDCGSAIVSVSPRMRASGVRSSCETAAENRRRASRKSTDPVTSTSTATTLRPLPLGCARMWASNVRRSGLPRSSSWSSACPVVATSRTASASRGPMSLAAVPGATPANASRAARLARTTTPRASSTRIGTGDASRIASREEIVPSSSSRGTSRRSSRAMAADTSPSAAPSRASDSSRSRRSRA